MPVPKNKPTTLSPEGSTSESSSDTAPEQEEFRQHLRRLAVSAVQVLLEQVMREELDESHWGLVGRMHAPSAVGIAMGPTPAIW
jgi:putative transposase